MGQALCLDCYDYAGAVLFNALAGELWRRFTIYLRRELAAAIGESHKGFDRQSKVSFAKVAEFQARGVVHFHAVIRFDGPEGPSTPSPSWGTVELLDACTRRAVRAVRVAVPDPAKPGQAREMRFGRQVDVQPIIEGTDQDHHGMTSKHVAAYVAKYVTKAAETTGTVDRRIKRSDLDLLRVPPHTGRMIRTCFELDNQPAYAELLLGKWAHMLGYRGHVATKSRAFSTTYGQLRGERRAHQEGERRERQGLPTLDDRLVITETEWKFIRAGLAYGEKPFVDNIQREQRRAHDAWESRVTDDAA